MNTTTKEDKYIHVSLGTPIAFGGEKDRDLLVAAALAARAGTRDPVDMELLSAASHQEDLRHYQQLAYSSPDPQFKRSITRIRHLDTGQEEMIARGDLESVLYLCRADESTRYHASMEADLREVDGFRVIGVAHGFVSQPDGGEKWKFLGFIPVKATRLKRNRKEAPNDFCYVVVWDWQLRFLHWAAFLAILTLSLTGWLIGSARLVYAGPNADPYFIGYLRLVHFTAGWLLVSMGILRIAGLFMSSTKYQRWRALFPISLNDLKNLVRVGRNYLLCIFEQGPHYIGHNPLQQVAYTGIYLISMLAILTGFCLYAAYDTSNWLFRSFFWLNGLIGIQYVRLIHFFMMYVFLAFIPIHVYLAIRADTIEREGAISSIFSGGRWCRKGIKFEDG
ncbi:MAG: Ni/Fe-hydrogenase, b-type cytochrome subunit [Desulfuromonadaceae bacterium]|nr:Ni/Fe-hydrogenase, b-type cytochrome subunit [Desulfuromonadaceae bacterium]